ncbi:hypothetical protein Tco_0735146 [Tanacetum coccineum]
MLQALRSFFFWIFCSAVTAPGIVVVDVPSSFVVVQATGLKELPSSMISQEHSLKVEWNEQRDESSLFLLDQDFRTLALIPLDGSN